MEQLRHTIHAWRWRAGAKLPSTRELSRRIGASRPTIHHALLRLQEEGLVVCRARSGWYLAEDSPLLQSPLAPVVTPEDDMPDSEDSASWMRTIFHYTQRCIEASGSDLLLLAHWEDDDGGAALLDRRIDELGERLGGVLFVQPMAMRRHADSLDARGIPWVVVNRADPGVTHNFVSADHDRTGRTLGGLWSKLGYDDFVFIGPRDDDSWPSAREKWMGLLGGYCEDAGHAPRRFEILNSTSAAEAEGHRAMSGRLDHQPPPRAVYAHGDHLAIGAMRACMERGLRVPEDVAVVGSTGLDAARYVQPSLTVVAQPMRAMGHAAGEMLLHMYRSRISRVPGRVLPCSLVFRDSFPKPALAAVEHRHAERC